MLRYGIEYEYLKITYRSKIKDEIFWCPHNVTNLKYVSTHIFGNNIMQGYVWFTLLLKIER